MNDRLHLIPPGTGGSPRLASHGQPGCATESWYAICGKEISASDLRERRVATRLPMRKCIGGVPSRYVLALVGDVGAGVAVVSLVRPQKRAGAACGL